MAKFNICRKRKYLKVANIPKDKAQRDFVGIVGFSTSVLWSGSCFSVGLHFPWCCNSKESHGLPREVKLWGICWSEREQKILELYPDEKLPHIFQTCLFSLQPKAFVHSAEGILTKNQCFLLKKSTLHANLSYKGKMNPRGAIPKGFSAGVNQEHLLGGDADLEELKIKPEFLKALCVLQTKSILYFLFES